jgi:hypothetical protein
MPVIPIIVPVSLTATDNGDGTWTSSGYVPVSGSRPYYFACLIYPVSPSSFPADDPYSCGATVTDADGSSLSNSCSYDPMLSSSALVLATVSVPPPPGGFKPGNLKLTITLNYNQGVEIPA